MTVGISMDQEMCLVLGQVSLSLLYLKRNLQTDICGPGGDWQNGKQHRAQIIYDHGEEWQGILSWRRSTNGKLKNQSSIMLEDYEESSSSTLRTRSSRTTLRMLEEIWKHQWLQPCLARQVRKTSMVRPVAKPMISSLILRVSWKPVNPQDCVWKSLYQIIMRTILQERETIIYYNITICYTNLFLCLKPWRCPQQKQQWIKNGRNLKRFLRGTWQKSEINQRWSMKQGWRAQKFILPHWWTSVIWRMPNWRQSTKNTKVELYFEMIL